MKAYNKKIFWNTYIINLINKSFLLEDFPLFYNTKEGSTLKSGSSDKQNNKLNIFNLLRIAQGIKVKELAEELDVTPAYINAIESGEKFPSKRLLRDYAQALDVDVETILTFNPDDHSNKKFKNVLLSILQMICEVDD